MGDNQRGSIKSVLIWLLILFVILGGTWVFLFYFFGLPIPLLTFFGWGNVYYECIPHECSELKEENNCNVAVVASQHRNCLWIENTCKKDTCASYNTQTSCKNALLGRKCSWIKRKGSDYRYDYAGCTDETDNLECTWSDNPDAYFGPCIRKTCNGYDKRGSCLNISKDLNCDWIRNKCRSRGEALCRELKSLQCNGHPLCKWQK